MSVDHQEMDWLVLNIVLDKLPLLLQNKVLMSTTFPGDIERMCAHLCRMVSPHIYTLDCL